MSATKLSFSRQENSITPDFAVDKGYITGKLSNETKKAILNAFGKAVRDRLLENKPYAIMYENNGYKKRKMYNVIVKRTDLTRHRNPMGVFNFSNFNQEELIGKPTLKLRIETPVSVSLKINGRIMREKLKAVPINERYKFPKD